MTPSLRHDERGFSLIEVLVSAMLVAMAAVGVLAGIDGASHTSGDQRARATAASLAQQEIERLRAMPPSVLAGYVTTARPDSTDTRSGILFRSHTDVNWRTDINQGQACTGAANGTRYLSLNVNTTFTYNGSPHTVTQTGQAAVPITGNRLIVQVFKATKDPQPGVNVELRDSSNALVDALTTSSGGCVEWDFLTPGTYSVTVNQPGFITPSGATTSTQTATVAATGANTLAFDYDQPGTVTLNWYTQYDRTVPVWCPSPTYNPPSVPCPKRYAPAGSGMDQMTAANSAMPANRVFGTVGAVVPSLSTGASLFPFSSAYTIYPGLCLPSGLGVGAGTAMPTVTPGGTQSIDVRLNQFDLNAQYRTTKNGSYVNATGGRITYIRQAGDGCPSVRLPDQTVTSTGDAPWNGVPSGLYDICAEVQVAGSYYFANPGGTIDIRDFTSPSSSYQLQIQAYSTGSPGRCPL